MPQTKEMQSLTGLLDRVPMVSHSEIQHWEAEYQRQSQQNPRRRGPKRKATPPAACSAVDPEGADRG